MLQLSTTGKWNVVSGWVADGVGLESNEIARVPTGANALRLIARGPTGAYALRLIARGPTGANALRLIARGGLS